MTSNRAGERGQILILMAATMVVIVGIAALAVDGGFMYDKRNRMQAAADAGAKLLAKEVLRHSSICTNSTKMNTIATNQVTMSGFSGMTVTPSCPPADGGFAGTTGYVEVK